MTVFEEARPGVFPACYRDAFFGLRLRLYDTSETVAPDGVVSVEVGDDLEAAVTLGVGVVTVEIARSWGVSVDELVATATANVRGLAHERNTVDVGESGSVEVTVGHRYVSSLLTCLEEDLLGPEGAIVAVPRFDVLLTAPVVGAATFESLEAMMLCCDDIYDPDDGGISPHVRWLWHGGLHRITDRMSDGAVDIEPAMNVAAFYFVEALAHLVHPCEECDGTSPS